MLIDVCIKIRVNEGKELHGEKQKTRLKRLELGKNIELYNMR